ncbi:MFS transporter [Parasphingorhabdus sp.]|uniref:MFS transporter n=1 Tax=Parasphingorhabdus sp. TaxID=2709688 RepID=UPI003001AB9F
MPVPVSASTITAPRRISEIKLFLFSAACAVAVANGYYIHPLIAPVGDEFDVHGILLGLVPAFNQIALALGILLLLPLGDRINNRKLVILFVGGQFLAMLAMALSQNFLLFVAASSLLGFMTITPYLLPAYVTKRVRPDRIGHVTGIMSAGITVGLLGSRAGGGVLGQHFGWRAAYWVGAGLTALLLVIVPLIMEKDENFRDESSPSQSYGAPAGVALADHKNHARRVARWLVAGPVLRIFSRPVARHRPAPDQSGDGLWRRCGGLSCSAGGQQYIHRPLVGTARRSHRPGKGPHAVRALAADRGPSAADFRA